MFGQINILKDFLIAAYKSLIIHSGNEVQRTIPVKFDLTTYYGESLTDLPAKVYVINDAFGENPELVGTAGYSSRYSLNIDTNAMTVGPLSILVSVDGGETFIGDVDIILK